MATLTIGDWVKSGERGRFHAVASAVGRGLVMACGRTRIPTMKAGFRPTENLCDVCDTLSDMRGHYEDFVQPATRLRVPPPRPQAGEPIPCDCGCDNSPEGRAANAARVAAKEALVAQRQTEFEEYLAKRSQRAKEMNDA